ncbi:cAMP-dependent protein kinase catalytic subunit-like [Babylonia areolata]|uniref:cAMP-dependent protein kinase catalytic subunit-like n=1 Tax=Babylonia areolata TaxID=304850 RepID=UPI003FD12067
MAASSPLNGQFNCVAQCPPGEPVELQFQYMGAKTEGTFGKVALVSVGWRNGGAMMTLMQRFKVWDECAKHLLMTEFRILREARRGPFLARLLSGFQSRSSLYLLREHYSNGSLQDHIVAKTTFTGQQMTVLAAQMCEALEFLHERSIVHRDVKPENIMFTFDGHSRLVNFQSAFYLTDPSGKKSQALGGTISFWAPELFHTPPVQRLVYLSNNPSPPPDNDEENNDNDEDEDEPAWYDQMVDWWALGLTILNTVMRKNVMEPPRLDDDAHCMMIVAQNIRCYKMNQKIDDMFTAYSWFSRGLKLFVLDLMKISPDERLGRHVDGLSTAKEHQLFRKRLLPTNKHWENLQREHIAGPLCGGTGPVTTKCNKQIQLFDDPCDPCDVVDPEFYEGYILSYVPLEAIPDSDSDSEDEKTSGNESH